MLVGFSAGRTTDILARVVGQKLNREVVRILGLPDVKERLASLGAEPTPTTAEQFDKHIRAEIVKFKKVVRDAHIEVR